MADKFWVGGTGTWDSATTTNWSLTAGGGGGAAVPTATDDVKFDASSGAGTCTKAATGLACGSIDMTGSSVTVAWASRTMTCIGGAVAIVKLVAAKCSGAVSFTFTGTVDQTFTSDGYGSIANISRGGASGTTQKLTFLDAVTMSGTLTLSRAKLDLNGFNVTVPTFSSSNALTREFLMGAGTLSMTTGTWETTTTTGMTLTIGTATIAATAALTINCGAGLTLPPVVLTGTALGGGLTLNTASAITSLKAVRPTGGGGFSLTVSQAVTINGQFIVLLDAETSQATLVSSAAGTARTITASGGYVQRGSLSFTDITAAGITPWIARDESVNVSNNTNIVFSGHSKNPSAMELMGVGM